MKERDDKNPLERFVQLDDAYWGGVRRGSKGREAKGQRPFVAAVSMDDKAHPIAMRFSALTGFGKHEITRRAKTHLKPKALVISDVLACFRGVEDA